MITPILQIEHLVKQYHKSLRPSVDDISFAVEEGEFFAFLGPNGAGKTTTISILTTTLARTSGHVTIAGYDLDKQIQKIREKIGVIFQKPSIDANLTAEENIRLHVCIQGIYAYKPIYRMMPVTYRQRIEELASIIGLEGNLFKPMKTFSGGMQRKLEIIRSLMHQPAILFLDEPTTGLDAVSRSDLWQYLNEMRKMTGTTIFLTTHYIEEAENADHICIVNHGKIALHATPAAMKQNLLNRHMLLDSYHQDQLRMELTERGIPFDADKTGFKIPYEGLTPQDLIASLRTPLSLLKIYEPSLEEAYINMIGVA